jgi:PKD repeat protein
MKPKLLIPLFLALSVALVIVSLVSADTNAEILYPTDVDGTACIGSNVIYDFRITNEGTISTVFSISYTSTWTHNGPTITPQLSVGAYYDFQVSVYIPWTAEPGDYDLLTLSVIGGGFSESATVTTTATFLNDWIDGANTDRGVRWPSVVYSGGNLYKIGGDNAGPQKWLDIYNTGTDIWSQGSDMPGARFWIDCEAISGKIYCGGGFTNRAETTLYIYDIATNLWSTGPELPYGVYSYASAALNGKYYLIGGIKSGSGYTNTMLVYDPASTSWDTTRAAMSTTRRMHSAGVIAGKIYVAGGYNGSYIATAEVYDPELNTWSSIASMPSPWVNAADGINLDRYLILAGGSPDSTTSSSAKALIYDSATNSWNWLPDMDHAIYGAEGDSDGTHFWLSSGQIFIDGWTASLYTTLMDPCATTCPSPVSGADFTWYPSEPWTGYIVEFTATTTSGSPVIDFSWSFNDGSSGIGKSINHVFNTPSTYTVEMTATNCDGASVSTKSHDIIVVDPPTIEASPPGLEATLLPDQTAQRQLQLCNDGGAPLEWVLSEVDALPMQLNGEIPWLSESTVNGVIPADSCILIDVFFSSIGLSEAIFVGNLSISSTDPVNPLINVPVSLTVSSSAIELIKTVGLIDNACGTTDQLNVYLNTTVYYCYTVTNTGGVMLNLHNLMDDQLGELLNSFNYPLNPGASFYVISDGVLITETVTNMATWYAEYEEQNATDSDSATVTVIPDPDFWIYLPTILKIPVP